MPAILKKVYFISRLFRRLEPKYGVLLVTNRCNLDCAYCQVKTKIHAELKLQEWTQIVNTLSDWGVSHFNILGGEPLLRKDLFDLVGYISQKGLGASITTNGLLLTETRVEKLAQHGLFMLIVSLDDIGKGFKGNFKRIISLLAYARALGVVPVVHSVVTSENVKGIPELASKIIHEGIFYSCSIYQAVGGLQSRKDSILVPNADDIKFTFDKLKELKRQTGMIRTTYEYMNNSEYYVQQKWQCNPNETKWIAVQSNGNIMPCAEWATSISALDKINVNDWQIEKGKIVSQCSGCYYECYYSEELVFSAKGLLKEIPRSGIFWRTVAEIIFSNLKTRG